jgi:SP family myo-inositol transporter-like MFS transporter 13
MVGTFWLYGGLSAAGLAFLIVALPETKGKDLEDIEQIFEKPWFGAMKEVEETAPIIAHEEASVQYVHIRGLNRDGRDSDAETP